MIKFKIFLIVIFFLVTNFSFSQNKNETTISIAAVGDLMCHSTQFNAAHVAADSFNFNPVYNEVKYILSSADFTMGNFETVTAGINESYSGYPFFNAPDDFIDGIKYAGFDYVSLANNHCLDRGVKGLKRTLYNLTSSNINYGGAFISERDRDSIRIFNIKGIKLAVLAYTYGTNGITVPSDKKYVVNLIDINLIKNDIEKARNVGGEIILVHFHYGEEYKHEPVSYQKEVVNKTIEAGADIIIGGHPHFIQPTKFYKTENAKLDSGFVAYSLGNFISNQYWRYSDAGVILKLYLTKNFDTDRINISGINFIPTWVYRGTKANRKYKILPAEFYNVENIYPFLSFDDKEKMEEAFFDTKEIFSRYSNKVNWISTIKEIYPIIAQPVPAITF